MLELIVRWRSTTQKIVLLSWTASRAAAPETAVGAGDRYLPNLSASPPRRPAACAPVAPNHAGQRPGHLGLFGYEPLAYSGPRRAGALGIEFDLRAATSPPAATFCTVDGRASSPIGGSGRIATESACASPTGCGRSVAGRGGARGAGEGASLRAGAARRRPLGSSERDRSAGSASAVAGTRASPRRPRAEADQRVHRRGAPPARRRRAGQHDPPARLRSASRAAALPEVYALRAAAIAAIRCTVASPSWSDGRVKTGGTVADESHAARARRPTTFFSCTIKTRTKQARTATSTRSGGPGRFDASFVIRDLGPDVLAAATTHSVDPGRARLAPVPALVWSRYCGADRHRFTRARLRRRHAGRDPRAPSHAADHGQCAEADEVRRLAAPCGSSSDSWVRCGWRRYSSAPASRGTRSTPSRRA